MRILVISRSAWRNDNSAGNTLTDFFSDFPMADFYSLCMRDQAPQNHIAQRNFFISEGQMLKRLFGKGSDVGAENSVESDSDETEIRFYNAAKKHYNVLLMLAREVIWDIGGWKNDNLRRYIAAVNPDIIFFPVFGCYYPHKVLKYIHSITNAKIALFHADDNYTLRQFSLSPFYWLYRFGLRKWVRRTVRISDLQYCISDVQKDDYDRAFGCECKVLTKFADFDENPPIKIHNVKPLQLVFTGNININRWKSLAMLANALQRINQDETKAQLRIYTATPLTKKMVKALEIKNTSFLMGSVPADRIPVIQSDADILVHAEGMDKKHRLMVRQSFSTKIVDYFKSARPIVAVGPKDVASIKHLLDNDAAIVADNETELYEKLVLFLNDEQALNEYAIKAYTCGRVHHDKKQQLEMLFCDFSELSGVEKKG